MKKIMLGSGRLEVLPVTMRSSDLLFHQHLGNFSEGKGSEEEQVQVHLSVELAACNILQPDVMVMFW